MAMSIDRTSREYAWVQITSGPDLSAATMQMTFTANPDTRPSDLDYLVAEYVDDGKKWARLLISGPGAGGAIELGVGDWQCWWRGEVGLQRPVRRPGTVTIL